jgi:hypothetical protein
MVSYFGIFVPTADDEKSVWMKVTYWGIDPIEIYEIP